MTVLLEARQLTKVSVAGSSRGGQRWRCSISRSASTLSRLRHAIVGESGPAAKRPWRACYWASSPQREAEVMYLGKTFGSMTAAERRAFRRDVQVIFQDPYDAYNPFYKIDHVLAKPIANFGLARSKSAALGLIKDALEAVRTATGGHPRALPAPTQWCQRQPHHGRPGAAGQTTTDHRRRAGVDGPTRRCARPSWQPAQVEPGVWYFGPVHPRTI